jgi:PAS domain S-box-containing protein
MEHDVDLHDLMGRLALLARALTSDLDADEILDIVLRQGMAGLHADGGVIASLEGNDTLVPTGFHGYATEVARTLGPLDIDRNLPLTTAARQGEAVWVSSRPEGLARFPELARVATATQAWMALPLVFDDVVIGAMGVTFTAPRPFIAPERAYLKSLAGLASLALVAVNEMWTAFGAANAGDPDRCGVGMSYLDVCDRASGAVGANEVGGAIRAVLRGGAPSVDRVTIPCHSPTEQRWFDIVVAGRVDDLGQQIGATVMVTPAPSEGATIGLHDAVARGVIDASPDAMVVCDGDGRILLANNQVEVLFGRDRTLLVGEPIETLVPERFRSTHHQHRTGYGARPTTRAMGDGSDLYALRRDGTEFAVEIALSPLAVGDAVFTIATVRDITSRRAREAAERAVKRSLDLARDGIVLIAMDTGTVVYANDGFCGLAGYSCDDLAAMRVRELCPLLSVEAIAAFIQPVLDGRQTSASVTTVLRHSDGHDVTIEALVQCPIDEYGARHHFIAVVRDIDERLRRDSELQSAHQALALAEDRERIARDLHDNVIQRLFACGLALAASYTQIPTEAAERVGVVIDQIDETIRDLRNAVFALSTTGGRDGDLGAEVKQICHDAARSLGAHPSLDIRGPIDTTPSHIRPHLAATLREALSNIARHAHATKVTVEIISDDRLRMMITDDGIGLPPGGVTFHGNGLRNLDERARTLGGTFDIAAATGHGTTLSWIVPI